MRLCATSDLHGFLPNIPPCDVLIISGDLCPHSFWDARRVAKEQDIPVNITMASELHFQRHWIATQLNPWLCGIKDAGCQEIIATWGNHDFVGEDWCTLDHIECTILNDKMVEFDGLTFYGSPWTEKFSYCDTLDRPWAFMLSPLDLYSKHNQLPKADVLICHSPPFGIGDVCFESLAHEPWKHAGSKALMEHVLQEDPKLVICGHIHHGQCRRTLGNTTIANVSLVSAGCHPTHPPQMFEL